MSTPAKADRPMLTIRQKLLFLVVLASLPALGLALYTGLHEERHALLEAEKEAGRISRDLAQREQHLTAGARQFLATLARLPAVRKLDARACSPLFRELLAANPLYSDVVLTNLEGDVLASASGTSTPVNLRDSDYFGRVLASRYFAVGGYRKSRTTGYDVLVCGHPVFGQDGALAGVVSTGLRLDVFEETSRGISLPPGSTVFMVDRAGLRLFNRHYPDPRPEVYPRGKPVTESIWRHLSTGGGSFSDVGIDGRRRLFFVQQSRLAAGEPPYLYVVATLVEHEVRKGARAMLYWNLGILSLAIALAAAAAWFTGRRVFAERIERLAGVAGSFARGDLSARADVPGCKAANWPDELDLLGRAVNRMGEELSRREAEREAVLERLARTQFAVDKAGDEIFWADAEGRLVYVNESVAKSLGFERQELVGKSVFDFDADHRPEQWRELLEHLSGQGPLTLETRHRHRSGALVPKELTMSLVHAGGGDLIFGIGRDIRERKRNEAVLRSLLDDTASVTGREFFEALTARLVAVLDLPAAFAGEYLDSVPVMVRPLALAVGGDIVPAGDFPLADSPGRDIPRDGFLLIEEGATLRFPQNPALSGQDIQGYLGVPILDAHGVKIGHLSVMSRQPMRADEALVGTLRLFALRASAEIMRLRAESGTLASLREKEVLLREIHHRVKNNMQIISSLLSLQARDIDDPAMQELVSVSRARIMSMALVHEDLYQSESLAQVDFRRYLERLADRVLSGMSGAECVRFELDMDALSLPVDQAVPLGLLCNELLTNALKHAFPGAAAGVVTVTGRVADGLATITVRDNGRGLPPDFDPDGGGTLGMQLVWSLADQLHGQIAAESDSGAVFVLRFPLRAERGADAPPR